MMLLSVWDSCRLVQESLHEPGQVGRIANQASIRGLRHYPQGVKNMDIPEDPPPRFLPGLGGGPFSEAEFLHQQVAEIEAYVERFPSAERDLRALAWIEANASQYRQQWQIRMVTSGRHRQSMHGG